MKKISIFFIITLLFIQGLSAQNLKQLWDAPSEDSKSWVIWYWMHGAVSKEGITADLEAMKEIGVGGAYLMPIKGVPEKPFIVPIVEQLSPLWWEMVEFAFNEADRLGLHIGFHVCDGFALAGGPWITPELSMQKVVWSQLDIKGGKQFNDTLPTPENYQGYYKDIAVYAYPTPQGEGISTETVHPKVTTDVKDIDPQFLPYRKVDGTFRSEDPCWIQYEFDQPFTCRTIEVDPSGNNFQAQRLTILASDNGVDFRKIVQLEPPRQGWQNTDYAMTHSIPPTTARYFRFAYDLTGTEPGAEDLDAAKWKQSLKIKGIYLSSEARIHQYEGKNGSIWRVSPRTEAEQIPTNLCIKKSDLIDVTKYLDADGKLNWKAPKGNWTILRMGHTSTGYINSTGGKGAGLESDKFNPEAIRLQFNSWFAKAYEVAGEELASRVIKLFHMDSWECGSQNWSPVFREEFKERRGYDIYDYLPVMAGIPLESAETSERILYDVRQTIADLIADNFYGILKDEAHAKGCRFTAESVAPVGVSDGMLHYKNTDIPMNEFWLESPTHDKPNDVLDAISGAHIYEKNVVKAEAFTQLRMVFTEYPGMMKTMQDRHYALGINKLAYHVYVLNPWLDRKPGMTLDGIGMLFQRDQTWWPMGHAWVSYAQRCQALLQYGRPVVDIAVFSGEEYPRRSVLPDRLVPFLPGIFGKERVEQEAVRLANVGAPTRQKPVGVNHSSNITDASDWVNALHGYQYDSFNPDALLRLMTVKDGQVVLPGGMKYKVLVVPGKHPMQPNAERMSKEVAKKLQELSAQGATILIGDLPVETLGLEEGGQTVEWNMTGKFVKLPYTKETFEEFGVERDFIALENDKQYAKDIAYIHRQSDEADIYFVANQLEKVREIQISLRTAGRVPELWNPVTGEIKTDNTWTISEGRTVINITLQPNESCFVVLQTPTAETSGKGKTTETEKAVTISSPWMVSFSKDMRGVAEPVEFKELTDWSEHENDSIRYYSGIAVYKNEFNFIPKAGERYTIQLDEIANLAEVKVNGINCGVLWTYPYQLDITQALKSGKNTIEISVANTWANRVMGDEDFGIEKDESKRIWTNARYRLAKKELVKSGLIGTVSINRTK